MTRNVNARVRSAKGRKISSIKWLQRQLNDPYVSKAKSEGYRSRAAYKIIEIDEKFKIFSGKKIVIDLGSTPGGWSQVAVSRVKTGKVIAVDLNVMDEIPGCIFIHKNFLDDDMDELLKSHIDGKADIVLSDMAASSCGHAATDHMRIVTLCEAAFGFAKEVLSEGGVFVAKILKGGTENVLLQKIKQNFSVVKHFKPPSSRADSAESYIVAMGFKAK